ncbi:MAG: hypothetical protein ACKVIN_02900, partial [Longimicrobiales bacterium]
MSNDPASCPCGPRRSE